MSFDPRLYRMLIEWPKEVQAKSVELAEKVMRQVFNRQAAMDIKVAVAQMPPEAFYPPRLDSEIGREVIGGIEVSAYASEIGTSAIDVYLETSTISGEIAQTKIKVEVPFVLPPEARQQAAPRQQQASQRPQAINDRRLARPQTTSLAEINSAASPNQMAQAYDINQPEEGVMIDESEYGPKTQAPAPEETATPKLKAPDGERLYTVLGEQLQILVERFTQEFMNQWQ